MKHGFKQFRTEYTPNWICFNYNHECQIQNQENKYKISKTKKNPGTRMAGQKNKGKLTAQRKYIGKKM